MTEKLSAETSLRGYAGVLTTQKLPYGLVPAELCPVIHCVKSLNHLADRDVVALNPNGYVRTLFRVASEHNVLFATDRCNSFCLMCSQPPRDVDDSDRLSEHLRLIELIDPRTREMGITGGEPTLLKDGLIHIVRKCKEFLPQTAIHILSNGRLFYYGSYAHNLAEVGHTDLMVGIPLYADTDHEHDYIVQSRGAFDETMVGFQNLGRHGVAVEVRVVTHRLTVHRLENLAEFIYRNLPFAAHVAFMGLETVGFAVPNIETLWVDPWDYRHELEQATRYLADRGMHVSIYNHQLCTLPVSIWTYSRMSISDWKNEYLPICSACTARERCGGFFSSSIRARHSEHIGPFEVLPA
ncbi:MAG TPA: His-Xaa-Ser system radical SAM maturase HxsC [Candidatus Polarisedimenticolia bacterium]|nr:His-Xaa-Ser system radical SAM maturase HxsC [Candidatus Polarisedimenticolia bacterium]